jgi:transposase InsO family protein
MSARAFLDEVRRVLPVAIRSIQTDHGSEFGWDFTWHLRDVGITHARIPRGHPQSNGKVERSHRTDEEEFYRYLEGVSLNELAQRMAAWEQEYNFGRPHLSLEGQTPVEALIKAATVKAGSVQDVS